MDHTTGQSRPDDPPPDAVVLPTPRHDQGNDQLPPLIGPALPDPTLPDDAGRPIAPPSPEMPAQPWIPGQPWRPGGGLHGHTRASSVREPLAGIPPARPTLPAARIIREVHDAAPERRSQRRLGGVVATAFVAALFGAGAALGAAAVLGAFDDAEPVSAAQTTTPPVVQITEIVAGNDVTPASAVALKVVPSIVTVEVGTRDGAGEFIALGSGSGVVLAGDGAIATNHHVIDGADGVRVIFQDGRIFNADIVGSDQLTDLAVLRIEGEGLTPIELGSTSGLVIGETAIAVGNPLGLSGGASLTVGVVSAFGREVQVGPTAGDRLFGMLQTDAPITNGSSGGALVNGDGQLIGITTAIGVSEAGAEGIGFAIPVELVTRITDELLERGDVRHAFLGVGLRDFLEDQGAAQIPAGATISNIEPGTAAEVFGLEVGDRIVAVDSVTVVTTQDVINTLRLYRVGDTVQVELVRDGVTMTVDVDLGERPEGI